MNLVPENMNEAIKHLGGRSKEEIKNSVQNILDEAGYNPSMKKILLSAIKLELKENKIRTEHKFKNRRPVEFLTLMLHYIDYFLKRDFEIYNNSDIEMMDYIKRDLKKLIEKYI